MVERRIINGVDCTKPASFLGWSGAQQRAMRAAQLQAEGGANGNSGRGQRGKEVAGGLFGLFGSRGASGSEHGSASHGGRNAEATRIQGAGKTYNVTVYKKDGSVAGNHTVHASSPTDAARKGLRKWW